MRQGTCARCGASFKLTRSNRRYCSRDCQVAQNQADKTAKREALRILAGEPICPGCDKPFVRTGRQKYCSLRCGSRIRQRVYRNLNAPASMTRECQYCTEPFSSPDGRQYYCSDECSKTAKSLRQAFRLYGITMEQYRTIWVRQNGVCAICKRPERTERNRLLTVDHDHVTGHVRGLLCSHCNRAIGLLLDDPKVIEAAARYVKENRQMKLVIV